MNARENLLSLFRRDGYESVPVQFSLCPDQQKRYVQETGGEVGYDEHFNFPWRGVPQPVTPERNIDWSVYYPQGFKEGTHFSEWGVGHEPGSEAAKHMTHMLHPMESFDSLEQILSYPLPELHDADWTPVAAGVKALQARGLAAHITMGCTIWEISWYLRSMEELMMEMVTGDEKAIALFDRITDVACLRAAGYASAGVDILHTGDDIGMQHGIMMSEEMYREWIKPRFAKVLAAARAEKPDIILSYHSCGFVIPFIEDLIEVGIDVLNPVQPECMDFAEIHEQFGDRLSFWGAVGTQTTMPFGTPEEVRECVITNLTIAGDKGGLLPAPTHLVEPEVPWENILAYVQACREFAGAAC